MQSDINVLMERIKNSSNGRSSLKPVTKRKWCFGNLFPKPFEQHPELFRE